jgi:outer membrane receptor protein involved in Fe transport
MIVVLVPQSDVLAKVYGKISGMVEDANTGEPMVGATVRVLGTSLTTTTDEDGEYFFLNVPVGKYDLAVTHVGFEAFTKKDVRILVDLTTPLDFEITQVAVELSEAMVVYAAEPVIQRDLTASRIIFTADRLQSLPNIVTVQAVLGNYPGVVVDRDDALHVRGGRAGQVTYYYDGFSVQDPFTADAGIRIMPTALEELSLTSGGFSAEYGEALSGVVNAVTPEGGSSYRARIRAYEGFTHQYDRYQADWGGLKRNDNRSLSANASGPIPGLDGKQYSFFAAGEYLKDNSYLPHNWQTSYTGALKMSLQPTPRLKLKTNITYFDADGAMYEHRDVNGISYDFNLDGLPIFEQESYLMGFSGNYYINERTIFSATVNRFSTTRLNSPAHLFGTHWSAWPGYHEDANGEYDGSLHEDNYLGDRDNADPYQVYGFTTGDDFDPTYSYRETEYNSFSGNLVKQVNKAHQLKTGFEYRQYSIFKDFRQFYNDQPYYELYDSDPVYGSFFIQDKIEYRTFVVNLGLRYDYRDPAIAYNSTPRDSTIRDGTPAYQQAEAKSSWSPRLGVSFPISTKSVMHFNYGVYYQMPQFNFLYFNPEGDIESGLPLLGNPDLLPERTTSYELGVDHLIGENLRFDITAYYKDIEDLVTARTYRSPAYQTSITQFYNEDYGSVKGFDVSLEKLPGSDNFSASIAYSYMLATGTGSNALEPYYNINTPDSVPPVTEYPLDFDQRHTVTAVMKFDAPRDWSAAIFGLKLPTDWGVNMVGYFGSGLPYTLTDQFGNRLGDRNQERLPAYVSVDMRFHKNFMVGPQRRLTFFVEVDNLFNRKNVINVYTRSGLPDDDFQNQGSGLALSEEEMELANQLIDHDPQNFSAPRTIRTGLEFSF